MLKLSPFFATAMGSGQPTRRPPMAKKKYSTVNAAELAAPEIYVHGDAAKEK
jgi:hypothetical protein